MTITDKEWNKGESPVVYIRNMALKDYAHIFEKVCEKVIVEPWDFDKPEPIPTADLTSCNVIFTLGLMDDLSILKYAPNVKWVQSISVGIDAMLHEDIIDSDIIITNTKGCTSVPIAEHTIAMITGLAKGLPYMFRNQSERKWVRTPIVDLENATVAIIGYGDIGKEIAKRAKALGMTVIGCRRNPAQVDIEQTYADSIVGMDKVDDALHEADFVVLALPSTLETNNFIDKQRISRMKEGSFLINVGRGNAIVESDLIEGLATRHLAGAALDVFDVEPLPEDHPFWKLDNLIVSAHQAYYSPRNIDRFVDLYFQNIISFSEGKPLLNVVNKQIGY